MGVSPDAYRGFEVVNVNPLVRVNNQSAAGRVFPAALCVLLLLHILFCYTPGVLLVFLKILRVILHNVSHISPDTTATLRCIRVGTSRILSSISGVGVATREHLSSDGVRCSIIGPIGIIGIIGGRGEVNKVACCLGYIACCPGRIVP